MTIPDIKSVRPFIGAKDFNLSRAFYKTIGFEELTITKDMSFFRSDNFGFYLQNYYAKDWVDNTMVFLELEQPKIYLETLKNLNLTKTFKGVKLSKMVYNDWGNEFFLHDPSGILWHIGMFK